ncbi:uncharacterized protein LOC126742512 [Anthonomus grandis grandis]|uniref:uncharacterized protein LOC126742512 n=1 Tax=Anthonomus grandis grandis TaxID=2921223 RepID=UPI002166A526|nr:uncharacterized protein LOC126742512 [Anthonomus grandis grandis]
MRNFLYLSTIFFIVILQVVSSQDLQQCREKIISQISAVKFGQYPKCFDASKLTQLKNNTDILHEMYKTITENCKSPTAENIKMCLEHFKNFLQSKSDEIQAVIVGAIHTFFDASRGCVDSFVDKVGNLDEWIQSGCEGDLPEGQ